MVDEVSFFETPANLYQATLYNIPENSNLHTRCRDELKFHQFGPYYVSNVVKK